MRVELSGDQWADLRDPATITNGQRRPLMAAVTRAQPIEIPGRPVVAADPAAVLAVGDAAIGVFVEKWSYDRPVPSEELESLETLPALDYDRLQVACGELMNDLVLHPGTDPTDPSK